MTEKHETLEERVGASFRRSVAAQGKAYAEYGALLNQFAQKKIKATDFGRRALDLYIGAVGEVVSTGVEIAGEALQTSLDRFSGVRAKAGATVAEATKANAPRRGRAAARRVPARGAEQTS